MNLLLDLSLGGSLVAGTIWLVDRALSRALSAGARRGAWLLVPLAFLVAIPLPVLRTAPAEGRPDSLVEAFTAAAGFSGPAVTGTWARTPASTLLLVLWLAGAALYLLAVVVQTRAAVRRWSGVRLSTDSTLLGLLEDAKAQLGITAPVGLVVVEDLAAPAIMGWLRPRILLPRALATSLSRAQLRGVLLHELAHFRALDVPLQWLFTLARAVHWFNPAVHLAARGWHHFCEEAADETVLQALGGSSPGSYGETLLAALRPVATPPLPFGALAIVESVHQLKRRLLMINRYPRHSPHRVAAVLVLTLLTAAALLRPVHADDPKQTAVNAMQAWLAVMDAGQYDQSWKDAAPSFQKAVSSDKWVEMSTSVRSPLGKCTARKLASAEEQTEVPSPSGTMKGDFVVAQFDTSFENLQDAVETVSFEKAPDGTWRVDGYYIKPRI